jgi:hypothetical protein
MAVRPAKNARVVPSLAWFLSQQYGPVRRDDATGQYVLEVDQHEARINPLTLAVQSSNASLRSRIRRTLLRAHASMHPLQQPHLHPEAFAAAVEAGREDEQ